MKTIISLFLLVFLVNCYSYSNISYDSGQPQLSNDKVYQLTLNDGKTMIVENLNYNDDSYTFMVKSTEEQKTLKQSEVKSIIERKYESGKTLGLALGIVGGAGLILGAAALATEDVLDGIGRFLK